MRMRQSIAEIERAFHEEAEADRERREALRRQAALRSVERRRQQHHKHGTARFVALCFVLVLTAVLVTLAMFETLYYVMG